MSTVLAEVADDVAVITLNRPERLNAYTEQLGLELSAALAEAGDRADVRAVVVTGAGRGFCAGADLQVLGELGDGTQEFIDLGSTVRTARTIGKPVIAAVNGPCVGFGLLVALLCDLRFTTPEAKFGTGFVTRGLVAEQGLAWLLQRLAGPARAADLLLSGRTITGEEAVSFGLANATHPVDEVLARSVDYARSLAAYSSPASMAAIKWQLQRAETGSLEQAVDDADALTRRSLIGRDFVEVGAWLAKGERPAYPPLPPFRLGETPPVELLPVARPRERA